MLYSLNVFVVLLYIIGFDLEKVCGLFAALARFITDGNHVEGVAEATRVFGNLSREKPVRDFLVSQRSEFLL